jgi:uncharacterized membrane protein YsdA (DUF1294 family)
LKQARHNNNWKSDKRYRSPYKTYFILALALTIILVAGLIFIKFPAYLAYLAGLNIVTFAFYAFDKIQAKRGAGRVPELVLHLLAVAGGAIGGLAGQWLLHHKTHKPVFHIVLWASLIVHIAIFAFFHQILP